MKAALSNEPQGGGSLKSQAGGRLTSILAWIFALVLVLFASYLGWSFYLKPQFQPDQSSGTIPLKENLQTKMDEISVQIPVERRDEIAIDEHPSISRLSFLNTIIPNRPRMDVSQYTVQQGDSVFEIAVKFDLRPESILWANYDLLNDNPDSISVGMTMNIPPTDGVLYTWLEGDTIDDIANRFQVSKADILNWSGNDLDLANPQFESGEQVMVPGGRREFRQWIIPTIPRGRAGVSSSVYGSGACEGGYEGAYGTGTFIWPAANHSLSGNDYWEGHLAIDIAAGEGAPIYAADSGVIVFAGPATGGYGNMVMIDHGNGYQTLYAHLSSVKVGCGQSVTQGNTIGYAGSTGNSTGAHLHFEVRYQGGFVNPWYILPAP